MAKKKTRKNKSTDNLSGLLDEQDIAIIAQLRNDGRMAYRSIAEIVGLSEAAVRQRVNRLVNNEICQITAVMDPKALGLNAVASVGMGLLSVGSPTLIAASTEISGRSRATGVGLMGLGNQLGGVGGAAFAGLLLANTGYEGVGYLCLGVTIISALAAGFLMRQPPDNNS